MNAIVYYVLREGEVPNMDEGAFEQKHYERNQADLCQWRSLQDSLLPHMRGSLRVAYLAVSCNLHQAARVLLLLLL